MTSFWGFSLIVLAMCLLPACVTQNVRPPSAQLAVANSVTVDEGKETLWKRFIPALG